MVSERLHFFDGSFGRLFAVHHAPQAPADRIPVVMCHPFGEEKLWAHRVFVNQARQLARLGHHVLRFDFSGHGDSDGDVQQSSLATAALDVNAAVGHAKALAGVESVALLGLRLGATTAWQIAASRDDVAAVVLWEPVLDGRRYAQELLRINLATQLAVFREVRQSREMLLKAFDEGRAINIDGYDLSKEFFDQLMAIESGTLGELTKPALVVQIDRAATPARSSLAEIAARFAQVRLEVVVEEPFWKECRSFCDDAPGLAAVTSAWLARS